MTELTPIVQDQSKAERVYHELRRRIRELTLPPGAPLRKEEIALEMGVSRAPVSEAIARLADEALVDVFPQHGSFVAPIRAADVRESLFIRTSLEVEAIRRATQLADAALLKRLETNLAEQEATLKAGDLAHFYDLDEALHAAIFSAMQAPRALRLLDAARAPLDRPRRIGLPEPGRPEATYAEHRRLVDAIASGDPEFAAAAMRAHLTMVARTVERELQVIEAQGGLIQGAGARG
ncbi:MAG TPA: GntR family transcriptional regulator [Caulobacteraceae bacterium]|jgi:DNA-binding GntR family transcriptional regulator|nr:GntR family transcriptional regulator [Caulobacteraceae bacterium]